MSSWVLRAAALATALTAVISAQAPHTVRRPVRPHASAPESAGLTPEMRIVVGHITANSLRGDVSFLASDALEGRDTPSRGLDIAGEYIASQFRRLGLEPAGDDGYFQNVVVRPEDPDSPKSRNVAAILRGSDPQLTDTYVILSAHYDHVGLAQTGEDRIFNGANDDASGTASVLEAANALAALHPRPKRSVLFILFCGEEKGLRGSRYYVDHPLVPLAKTIANLNLEQLGRTDAVEGPHLDSANVTGFDFSDITPILVDAGKRVGIAVSKDAKASDRYFKLSDNAPLAKAGIPAHTLSVTYEFPDYHAVGDEWQKIDYDNMAKVDQAVGIATLRLAQALTPPHWNEAYPAAKPYAEAAKKLHD
jgi:Peptidase family M28